MDDEAVERADRGHDGCVVAPRGRRIEVDEVELVEAEVAPARRHRHGIGEADELVVVAAASELDAVTIAKVDGGHDDHGATSSRNARIIAVPGADDFSGWNWTPRIRLARIVAGMTWASTREVPVTRWMPLLGQT